MKRFSRFLVMLLPLALCGCAVSTSPKTDTVPRGTGGQYTNVLSGISCRFDTRWNVYSEEQLALLNETVTNDSSTVELYAMRVDGGATVNAVSDVIGEQSEEDYLLATLSEFEQSLTDAGVTDTAVSVCTVPFAGAQRQAIVCSGTNAGLLVYETAVLVKAGDTVTVYTLCSYGTDQSDELLALFDS